jgi:hypothetical protein
VLDLNPFLRAFTVPCFLMPLLIQFSGNMCNSCGVPRRIFDMTRFWRSMINRQMISEAS